MTGTAGPATIIYALALIATSLSSLFMWLCAERDGVTGTERARRWAHEKYWGTGAIVLAFLPSIPLAFVSPMWARISWALAFPLGLLADRLEERRRPSRASTQTP